MTGPVSLAEWCEAWGLSERTARRYLADGRIPGAVKRGRAWEIPADATPPNTTPAHMRRAPRTIPGEVLAGGHPGGRDLVVPEAPRHTPEAPHVLFRPFVSLDDLAELCAPVVSRRSLAAMLAAGEIRGHKRGPGGGWIIPAAEVRKLRGDQP